jgi:hypothetical protein
LISRRPGTLGLVPVSGRVCGTTGRRLGQGGGKTVIMTVKSEENRTRRQALAEREREREREIERERERERSSVVF